MLCLPLRAFARVFAGLMAGLLALGIVAVDPAPASAAVSDRLSGANRYETAAEVAVETFPGGVSDVVLATGENFPDALAAAGIAGDVTAPVLLTDSEHLSPETEDALETLAPDTVHIAGGIAAVADSIEETLDALGYETSRLAGGNRYETAAMIADAIGPDNVADGTAIVTTGEDYADSVAAGPLAYAGPHPILLVKEDAVPSAT